MELDEMQLSFIPYQLRTLVVASLPRDSCRKGQAFWYTSPMKVIVPTSTN
jgi:hypothetical protein